MLAPASNQRSATPATSPGSSSTWSTSPTSPRLPGPPRRRPPRRRPQDPAGRAAVRLLHRRALLPSARTTLPRGHRLPRAGRQPDPDHVTIARFRARHEQAPPASSPSLPTIPVVAPGRASQAIRLGDGSEMDVQVALTALPGALSCSGSPVVSVPVGLVDGLPVGASLVGRIGADHELLRMAAVVEEAARSTARPALSA